MQLLSNKKCSWTILHSSLLRPKFLALIVRPFLVCFNNTAFARIVVKRSSVIEWSLTKMKRGSFDGYWAFDDKLVEKVRSLTLRVAVFFR